MCCNANNMGNCMNKPFGPMMQQPCPMMNQSCMSMNMNMNMNKPFGPMMQQPCPMMNQSCPMTSHHCSMMD